MKLDELKNKDILIVGFGLEGKATLQYLRHHFLNQKIDVVDKKDNPHYLEEQKKYDLAVRSPGVHKSLMTIPYTTPTNIFFANVKGFTIGVTGTKGKSTTTALIFAILKEAGKTAHLVGNITHKLAPIGAPMLTKLLEETSNDAVYVCELSSFQLDDIKYSPNISVFLNFFPEHMNYHGSVEAYWEAKKQIVANAKSSDYFVYNPNNSHLAELAKQTRAKALPFVKQLPFDDSTIPLIGEHNKDNVRAAVTVAQLLGIDDGVITTAIANFAGLPHRLENVGTYKGITFYDDAIATTPQSTMQAIKTLQNIGTIFLGGQDRGFDFTELAKLIDEKHIPNLVIFPDSGDTILKELQKISSKDYNIFRTKDMKEAVVFAYEHTQPGMICLLSTASPSYSVWHNFEEKGNLYKEWVKELQNK